MPKPSCSFDGCDRGVYGRTLCSAHYQQQWKGKPLVPLKVRLSDEDRFWQKVKSEGDCLVWTGSKSGLGYGHFFHKGKTRKAHRVSYEWATGASLARKEFLDHICHNASCVNPHHLRVATAGENAQNLKGAHRDSSSGVLNVYWMPALQKWRAKTHLNGKDYHLGVFKNKQDAEQEVREWRKVNMPFSNPDWSLHAAP